MNNNMLNHPQNTPCLSSQEMLDYTQGILSTQEQHRIEKHLLDCEFCSDSLEGIQVHLHLEQHDNAGKSV